MHSYCDFAAWFERCVTGKHLRTIIAQIKLASMMLICVHTGQNTIIRMTVTRMIILIVHFAIMWKHSLGPFTLAKTKIQKTWVFCCTVYTARKTHSIRGFLARKGHARKKPESHTCVLVSGAHVRLLSTFDRTRVVHITSRAAVGWFRWRSRTTWPKTRIIPARLERAFTLAKNQWNFGGVAKNHAAEVGFSIQVFWSV